MFKKSFMPLILAGSLLTACAPNFSTPKPGFWEPTDSRVYGKLSPSQESESVTAAQYLAQLIYISGSELQVAAEDAQQFSSLTTSSLQAQAGTYDTVLADEVKKCVRRQFTQNDPGAQTIKVWYDNAEGHICPFVFTAVETRLRSTVGQIGGTTSSRSLTINFAAKELTRQYDEGKIRSMTLTHTDSSYSLAPMRQPEARGVTNLILNLKGSMVLNNSTTVSFAIDHSVEKTTTVIDDNDSLSSGRDLLTVTMGMPFGIHALSYDTLYSPNSKTPSTRVVINGIDLSKKQTSTGTGTSTGSNQ